MLQKLKVQAPASKTILRLTVAVTLVAAMAGQSWASSRSNAARPVEGRDPANATIVMKATVTEIGAGRLISILTEAEAARQVQVEVADNVRIRAQDKKEFEGRKKLVFEDLAVGQKLRVTVLPSQERILSLVVLKGGAWRNT